MNPLPAPTDPRDDAELIRAVQRGVTEAFSALLGRHLDALHAFIALRLPVPHLVDELAHETFVFAFRRIAEFEVGTSFRAWLRAIAANKVLAELERHRREQRNRLGYVAERELERAAREPEGRAEVEAELLEQCLAELPVHLRDLLQCRYGEGARSEEIAARLQRGSAWVRTTLFRTRELLRDCLEKRLREVES